MNKKIEEMIGEVMDKQDNEKIEEMDREIKGFRQEMITNKMQMVKLSS